MTPIPERIEIAEVNTILQPERDTGQATSDFAGNKSFSAPCGFMIEQNAVTGI